MTTYTAHFTPEAWVNDQAIETDPEGPQEWDCTAYASEYGGYLAKMRQDYHYDEDRGALDAWDIFKGDPAAPEWVKAHRGPFTIRVRELAPAPIARGTGRPDEKNAR